MRASRFCEQDANTTIYFYLEAGVERHKGVSLPHVGRRREVGRVLETRPTSIRSEERTGDTSPWGFPRGRALGLYLVGQGRQRTKFMFLTDLLNLLPACGEPNRLCALCRPPCPKGGQDSQLIYISF